MPPRIRRRRKKQAVILNEVLKSSFSKMGLNSVLNLSAIRRAWRDIAGTNVAQNSWPDSYRDKCLHLTVSNSTWMNELTFLKQEIMENLNKKFPDLVFNDIKFKIGKLKSGKQFRKSPHAGKLKRGLNNEETAFIEDCLKDIHDGEMKEILTDMMARNIKINTEKKKKKDG